MSSRSQAALALRLMFGGAYTPATWDEWTATQKAKHGNGNGHGKSLHIEALRVGGAA